MMERNAFFHFCNFSVGYKQLEYQNVESNLFPNMSLIETVFFCFKDSKTTIVCQSQHGPTLKMAHHLTMLRLTFFIAVLDSSKE